MVVSRCSVKNWNFQAIMFDHWRCDSLRHTYVHFSCNAHAKKARTEKDGGAIGKAAWVAALATQFWAIYTVHILGDCIKIVSVLGLKHHILDQS